MGDSVDGLPGRLGQAFELLVSEFLVPSGAGQSSAIKKRP